MPTVTRHKHKLVNEISKVLIILTDFGSKSP